MNRLRSAPLYREKDNLLDTCGNGGVESGDDFFFGIAQRRGVHEE